jgi:hypothetical protein
MPGFILHPLHTLVFAGALIAIVPRKEIQRLSIFGIMFGGFMDAIVHAFGYITGWFAWTNYGPFGFIGVHLLVIFPGASFFIFNFYFLPRIKPFCYIF